MRRRLVAVILVALAAQASRPQAARTDVAVRVQTRLDTEGRLRDLQAITDALNRLGFRDSRLDPERDEFDPTANTLTGSIDADKAAAISAIPGVRAVLLTPPGFTLDAGGVEVRLTLPGGLDTPGRLALHRQTIQLLTRLGFREHVGYDDSQFRTIRGTVPGASLNKLLDDLRLQPAGWFLPLTLPDELPVPIRDTLPVRLIEVLPARPAAAPALAEPPLPPQIEPVRGKLSPGLTRALGGPDAAKQTRVEALLQGEPRGDWPAVRTRLRDAAPGVSVEGLLGTVVSLQVAKVADLAAVAAVPGVVALRLPQVGEPGGQLTPTAVPGALADWLVSSRLNLLHSTGTTGEGTTIAVIAAEFPDALAKLGNGLPTNTTLLDLTASLDPDLNPRPPAPGIGTATALVASAAAPGARVVLVRVDPAAAFQLLTVARAVGGERDYSEALEQRALDLGNRRDELSARRATVERNYARARDDFRLDDAGPARMDAARAATDQLKADETRLAAATDRFQLVKRGLDSLRGTTVVLNSLTWPAGYPQDGLSDLSRYLERNLSPAPVRSSRRLSDAAPLRPVWVQASSTAAGRVWAGPLLDGDGDGKLEFAPGTEGDGSEYQRELNFLRFIPPSGEARDTIPAGTKLRLVVQWREPRGAAGPTDAPALAFQPRLLRQLDPAGVTLTPDEFEPVNAIASPPLKLLQTQSSDAFEQVIELTIPAAGRYALQVTFGPATVVRLPGLRQLFEVSPRLVFEPLSPGGVVAFGSFIPSHAGVGVPGDSPAALTVGGGVGALSGGGPSVTLKVKPDLTAPDTITVGGVTLTGPAAGAALVAGGAASLAQAGVRADNLTRTLGLEPGQRFEIAPAWLESLPARPRR